MNALELFAKHAPNRTFLAVLFGSLSGLFYAFLIPIVMAALSGDPASVELENKVVEFLGIKVANSGYAVLFLSLVVFILVFKSAAEVTLVRIALDIRYVLRKDLYDKVLNSPIASLERVGQSRLIQSLSTDVSAIVEGAQLFPEILTNVVTLLGMLAYLAYLDFDVFIYIIEVIIFGVLTYQIPIIYGSKRWAKARMHMDVLQEAFKGLIGGSKELKLSYSKQKVYKEEVLYKQENLVRHLQKQGQTAFTLSHNYGGLLSFFAIGAISFIFMNYHQITNIQLIPVVMVLLYVTGPITILLSIIPQLAITRISMERIEQLYQELPMEHVATQAKEVPSWQTLRFKDVIYAYQPKSGATPAKTRKNDNKIAPEKVPETFSVGPLSLTVERGHITFIVGGNGSGKSTMSKVISQHYLPSEGKVYFDDNLITEENMSDYRQEISCIYSDYYLFERILAVDSFAEDYTSQIEHYIEAFGLKGKVELKDGHFTTLKLSDGQRRRLALVVAIVEDRSLYVFDEWAADQDPMFKDVFYREILPELRSRNKAVVVISHDDRYFDLADKILVMESGQLKIAEAGSSAVSLGLAKGFAELPEE